MIKLTIIAVGKYKETYFKDADTEYLKRLSPYANVDVIELPEQSFHDAKKERADILKKEAAAIEKHLKPTDVVITMQEFGKTFTSIDFAQKLETLTTHGEHLVFVVGGPLGIDESLVSRAAFSLSLSPMTFPHQLARVVLLEQVYRAMTIQRGKTYHY